jgi:hypothetical protein
MGKTISLFCEEAEGLKLGPGVTATVRTFQEEGSTEPLTVGDVIVFSGGFAKFDEDEFPDWKRWVEAPGTPTIRIVNEEAGEATERTTETVACPICGRELKSEFGLKSHLRTHEPKGATTSNPKAKKG